MTNLTNVPDPIIDNWSEQKEKLKLKISSLTGTSFNFADGEKDDMLSRVQMKLGKTKEELLKIISAI